MTRLLHHLHLALLPLPSSLIKRPFHYLMSYYVRKRIDLYSHIKTSTQRMIRIQILTCRASGTPSRICTWI